MNSVFFTHDRTGGGRVPSRATGNRSGAEAARRICGGGFELSDAAKRTASGSVYSYGTEFARYLLPLWADHASWINVSLWGKLMGNAFIETFNGNLHEEANCTGSRPVSMPEC
jgi:hypothetical protein